MTESSVYCTFHNVSSEHINIISQSLNISPLPKLTNNQLNYKCSLAKAYEIRSKLADSLGEYPQIWFSIDNRNFLNSSTKFNKNVDQLLFGSFLSNEKLLIHKTPLNENDHWTIDLLNNQTLIIENKSSIRLSFPLTYIHKEIFVIDNEDFSEIIFSYDIIMIDIDKHRIYGNNPIVQSLNQCTQFLISLSSKSNVNLFLNKIQSNEKFQIYFTTITIQQNQFQWSNNDLNSYRNEMNRYSISMLHSLGYVFDDKYLNNQFLQNLMIKLSEKDENLFYQLCLKAFSELKKCHWFDLTKIFNENSSKTNSMSYNDHQSIYVSVIHLTPTRLLIMPKEKTKGHRALRHQLFDGPENFCLVYLKADPPNIYLNENCQILEYFKEIFSDGIDLSGSIYHLFGASNSQIKEHSYWFVKAASLEEIKYKRELLGDLQKIRNLGTYVARLGLWFSKTDPTNIKLNYYSNENEFNRHVEQGEICVTMIDDIERNNYCFTDGNGLVSKGLAKLINEIYSNKIIPSAYQIRLAGCKGLIIIDPQSTEEQFYIKIRPSMMKFQSNHWILDICGYSRATPSRLNNQFIWLLSDLGVPDDAFFRLQQRWFKKKPSISNYSDHLLKNKIPLPVNECRYIYGCALESSLKEGQCFIRYEILNDNGKSFSNPKFDCVRGRVIVTKNPCPYAGDMLELWAVELPELCHLSDVIVFSTQGQRPDFNKIAGSDLDGDGYFIYWGEELRLNHQVTPLDYTPDDKLNQDRPITPEDVIKYCLSTINETSSGEIYNLHAIIVDKNYENCQQRTCQPLAIELARMFSSAVDSGKTGYVIDKKRIQQIRQKYGTKYPDFLGKDRYRSYQSESIVGKLYRNALAYTKGKTNELEHMFAQLNINDNQQPLTAHRASSPKKTTDQPIISNTSVQLHPGSPLSPTQNSFSINDDSSLIISNYIPSQLFLIDGMISSNSSIRFCRSTKPFYSEHNDLTRLRIELEPSSVDHFKSIPPSLPSLFFDQLCSFQYSKENKSLSKLIISFGYIYLLKYKEQDLTNDQYSKTLDCLLTKHFLPPLSNTFLPSTILERIEITKENYHCLQQIFSKTNHTIKREYIESDSNGLYLIFPWFKMSFIEHEREIIVICLNIQTDNEICIHFNKNGQIKSIDYLPKIYFKCFHQQNCSYRPDILYEYRSYSTINNENYSSILKNETLLDPTHPLTLPFEKHIIPIVSYSIITNIFQYEDIEVHIIRRYIPIHYKNDDYYKLRCILGYIEQNEQSVEIHLKTDDFNREKLRYIMSLANELSQMFN